MVYDYDDDAHVEVVDVGACGCVGVGADTHAVADYVVVDDVTDVNVEDAHADAYYDADDNGHEDD